MDYPVDQIDDIGFQLDYKDYKLKNTSPLEHFHNAHEIAFFMKADIQVFIKDRHYNIKDGDMLFIKEYEIHRILYPSNSQYARYVINFKNKFILNIIKALGIRDLWENILRSSNIKVETDLRQKYEIINILDNILNLKQNPVCTKDSLHHADIKLYLARLVIYIIKLQEKGFRPATLNKTDMLIKKIVGYIDVRYMEEIGLDILQNEFHLNKYYISHVFRKVTGFSVVEYTQNRRVIEAQKMLRETSKKIIDICYDCGFNNIQHFCRVFKKISKITPGKYRKG